MPLAQLRLLSFTFSAIVCFWLAPKDVVTLFIVAGQGHFFSAYLYKIFNRQITGLGFARWLGFAILLFASMAWYPNLAFWGLVTATYFMYHFLTDEHFLAGRTASPLFALGLIPIFILFVAFYIETELNLPTVLMPSLIIAGVTGGIFLLFARTRRELTGQDMAFLIGIILLIGFALQPGPTPFTKLFGTIVIYHYLNWYLSLYIRFQNQTPKLHQYLLIIVIANTLTVGLYFLFIRKELTLANQLYFLFDLRYFYLWTLLHLLASMRKRELGYLRPELAAN